MRSSGLRAVALQTASTLIPASRVHPTFRGGDKWKLLLLCSVLHLIADSCFATSLYDPKTDKYVVGRKGA
ncbi:MAG: hypothetical protein LBV40_05695 [Methanomicrobiales archaeon]|nr:hypothetical protein [Methanomicrobiales archaeon]